MSNRNVFLTVLGAEKYKKSTRLSRDILASSMTFLQCPHMVGKDKLALWGLFYKDANPTHEGSTLIT